MKSLTHDARGFVQGVVSQLKKHNKDGAVAPKVQSLLLRMTKGARKERQATVEAAVRLSPEEERTIARVLSEMSGHEVELEQRLNTDLIGGIRITMGDWVMDASMRQQLNEMAVLLKGE